MCSTVWLQARKCAHFCDRGDAKYSLVAMMVATFLEDVKGGVNHHQAEVVALELIDAEVTREDDAEVAH